MRRIGQRRVGVVCVLGNALLCVVSVALGAFSCSSEHAASDAPANAPDASVFGGSGGVSGDLGASGAGGGGIGGGAGADAAGGRCSGVPASQEPRIDNFEDGDLVPLPEPGRSARWSASDAPDGGTQSFAVEPGGARGTDFAAHFDASAFGVSLAVNLGGVPCPYNAARYRGVGFYVKGSGRVQLKMSTSDVFSTEFGGTCDASKDQCWDAFQKVLPLSGAWVYHEVRWDELAQQGWGKRVPLDPAHFFNLVFAATADALPLDMWIDELSFVDADAGTDMGVDSGAAGMGGNDSSP